MASKVEEARQGVMSIVNNIGWDTIANSLDLVPSALDALIAAVREECAERVLALPDESPEFSRAILNAVEAIRDLYHEENPEDLDVDFWPRTEENPNG